MNRHRTPQKSAQKHQSPRALAARIVAHILDQRKPLADAIAASGADALPNPQDRAYVRHLVLSTLRHLPEADRVLARFLAKPLPGKASAVRHALRMGTVQLLFSDTPAYATVGETVEAIQSLGFSGLKGLANAVLRNVSREGAAILAEKPGAPDVPDWLREPLTRDYGAETAGAIAAAQMREAPLDLTILTPGWEVGAALPSATRIGPVTLRMRGESADIRTLPGYSDGAWQVQDVSASLPALLLGDVKGKRVLDACAAPGGKTAQLIAAGARVTALDRSEARLQTLHDNLARLKLNAEAVIAADALNWQPDDLFDAILLDAPCTATGTIRRHPDLLYLKGEADLAEMQALQRQLLGRVWQWLAPGGVMVYATCSLFKAEGETQIGDFLNHTADAALSPIQPGELPGLEGAVTDTGMLRTLPHYHAENGGTDGFFAARLVKRR